MSEVLESLNIDKSFFVQFSIVLILFFSLKTFLFEKLLEVIKNRESKTTGLLSKSKEKESEAIEISRKIEEEIAETKSTLSLEIKLTIPTAKAPEPIAGSHILISSRSISIVFAFFFIGSFW